MFSPLAAASTLAAIPALALGPASSLRGFLEATPAPTVARNADPKPAAVSSVLNRKVRVVFASPYGK